MTSAALASLPGRRATPAIPILWRLHTREKGIEGEGVKIWESGLSNCEVKKKKGVKSESL